jgi:hypothetical protein
MSFRGSEPILAMELAKRNFKQKKNFTVILKKTKKSFPSFFPLTMNISVSRI